MRISVNGKLYDCVITAWTPIRYYLRFRESFTTEWNKVTELNNFDISKQEKLLTQLFYIAINNGDLLFTEFEQEAKADENFYSTAFLLFSMIFENNCKKRNGSDYGIEYNELTFLASFGKSGLPEKLLDEMIYFDVMEVMAIQGDLSDPENYKYKMATTDELKAISGITKKEEEEIEKYLLGGEK